MRILSIIVMAMMSTSAFASFYEECEFLVTPGKIQNVAVMNGSTDQYIQVLPVNIYDAIALGGHTDCRAHVGKDRLLQLKNGERYAEGEALTVHYSYMDSDLPTGMRYSESWEIIPTGGLLRMNCSQVDRMLPRYEVQLRGTMVPTPAMGLYYSAIFKKDTDVLAKADAVEVDINANVASLHTVALANMKLIIRYVENQEVLNAELRFADGTRKRMTCLQY